MLDERRLQQAIHRGQIDHGDQDEDHGQAGDRRGDGGRPEAEDGHGQQERHRSIRQSNERAAYRGYIVDEIDAGQRAMWPSATA